MLEKTERRRNTLYDSLKFLTGGKLQDHEINLAKQLGFSIDELTRERINLFYTSPEGLKALLEILKTNCFEVSVPEEGALLCFAYLLDHGNVVQANNILKEIKPYFRTLRFYPVLRETPNLPRDTVYLFSARQITESLKKFRSSANVLRQIETIQIWIPLYEKFISIFLDSCTEQVPEIKKNEFGKLLVREGRFVFKKQTKTFKFDTKFKDNITQLIAELEQKLTIHFFSKRPKKKNSGLFQISQLARSLVNNGFKLNDLQIHQLNLILARFVSKHGIPGSAAYQRKRERQKYQVKLPPYENFATELTRSLESFTPNQGITSLSSVLSTHSKHDIPKFFQKKIRKCLAVPIEAIFSKQLIKSIESLTLLTPQLIANTEGAKFADTQLEALILSLYRSNLNHQSNRYPKHINFAKIPWINALGETTKKNKDASKKAAKEQLKSLVALSIINFPYAPFPNALVRDLRKLFVLADIKAQLIDEVGLFCNLSSHHLVAASYAGKLLKGTFYEQYFGISYQRILNLGIPTRRNKQAKLRVFTDICRSHIERDGIKPLQFSESYERLLIEQQQILSTQNLALFYLELELDNLLRPHLLRLAKNCLYQTLKKTHQLYGESINVKLADPGWRHMIFFLALMEPSKQLNFADHMGHYLKEQVKVTPSFFESCQGLNTAIAKWASVLKQ